MKILVDVDLTVVCTDLMWWRWLKSVTASDKSFPLGNCDYNLSNYFKEELERCNLDGLDFFRGDAVYDLATPREGCVEALEELHEAGHEIIFCSALKGNHAKSKYYFLKRNFPFMKGVVFTKEKNLVDCDVIIDDRNEFLNMHSDKFTIKVWTIYEQNHLLEQEPDYTLAGWTGVGEYINKMLEDYENDS